MQINPFDDSFKKFDIRHTNSVNAPNKVDEQKIPQNEEAAGNISSLENTNENDLLDTSGIVDDLDNFSMSDFDNEEQSFNAQNASESKENSGENKDDDQNKKEEIMQEISQTLDNFFNKKE